ncbi:MAG: (d)CMP kinase [Gammaproteobacteria bacterium]|nr:(d)CMP kinase [Gammaproteobacteria bacterium]
MTPAPVIAIDGPSGSGKGTLAVNVAQRLGFHLLDSGALYRLTAYAAFRDAIDEDDEAGLAALVARLAIEFQGAGDAVRVNLDGEDVTLAIRDEACGMAASKIAGLAAVRRALLAVQRGFRRAPGLVADGRDMGTVVFPDATVKIFLTASAEERAQRRYKQLKDKGFDVNLRALLQDIEARDQRDTRRSIAPLAAAEDAIVIDSTALSMEQVQDRVLSHAAQRLGTVTD